MELSASVSVKLGSRLSASVNAKTTQSLDTDAKGRQESLGTGLKYDF